MPCCTVVCFSPSSRAQVRVCDGCFKVKNPDTMPQPEPLAALPGAVGAPSAAPPIGGGEPEPEPDGELFSGTGQQRIALPVGGIGGGLASLPGQAEDPDEGEEDYGAATEGLAAVDVPLPAAAPADAGPREETIKRLQGAAQARLSAIVAQLLLDEELGDEWAEQIVTMATRAIASVNIDPIDINFQRFVHVKRIPGGTIADESPRGPPVAEGWGGMGCGFTDGVVARKTVSHNKMATDLVDPKIMLVCAHALLHRLALGGSLTVSAGDTLLSPSCCVLSRVLFWPERLKSRRTGDAVACSWAVRWKCQVTARRAA